MKQQPDKLFRDKLYSYEKSLSTGAWKRISEMRGNSLGVPWWLKVAATLLLIAVSGIAIVSLNTKEAHDFTAHKSEIKKPPVAERTPATREKDVREEVEKKSITPPDETRQIKKQVRKKKAGTHDQKEDTTTGRETTGEPDELLAIPSSGPAKRRVTIVFSAEEVNEKYLTGKTMDDATSGEEKSSRFKKLLNKAYDLKYNQEPLGNLRQKKNEILAMNFKSTGQRSEN